MNIEMMNHSYLPAILTLEEAAKYIRVTPDKLEAALQGGHIPGLRFGDQDWRIKREELEKLLTFEEVVKYLRVTPDKLEAALQDQRIPGLRLDDHDWRIKREELEKLFSPRHQQSIAVTQMPEVVANVSSTFSYIEPAVSPGTYIREEPIITTTQLPEVVSDAASALSAFEEPVTSKEELINNAEPVTTLVISTTVPNSSRLRGRVVGYNDKQGFGFIELSDKQRRIIFDSRNLLQKEIIPNLGDIVEFEADLSKKTVKVRAIQVVGKTEKANPSSHSETGIPSSDKVDRPPPPYNKAISIPKIANSSSSYGKKTPSLSPGLIGTPQASKFYQEAAIAKTEKRFDDARRLFKKAIEAGAGTQVYETYIRLERESNRLKESEKMVKQAIERFPTHSQFYNMYGQMRRRMGDYQMAKEIFQQGLSMIPGDVNLRWGLGQTLVEIGTEESFKKAEELFEQLKNEGKLPETDQFYQRIKLVKKIPRVDSAYQFFRNIPEIKVGTAGQRSLPSTITQKAVIITIQVNHPILKESFNLEGVFLVACYAYTPTQTDIVNLKDYLGSINPQSSLGLLEGKSVAINPSLTLIAVPKNDEVRDRVMSFNSEGSIALVPLDDTLLKETENVFNSLQNLLYQYLGARNLYNSNQPVSGRRFFGREKLLIQLSEDVQQGHFLGIYGLRKMGKTSLVYQLRNERLKEEAIAYIDLQSSAILQTKNCASLYWELERDLYNRLSQDKEIAQLLRLGKWERFSDLPENSNVELTFNEDIRALLDTMSAGNTAFHKLVIVLDELENLLPIDGKESIRGYHEFFALLRGLAQTERYRGLLSTIVVAANAAISERGYWEGRENPVFAFFQPVFLPPLSKDDCRDMIVTLGKSMSVYWEEEAIENIFAETAGHPFITRVLCSHIIKHEQKRPLTVTISMVTGEIPQFICNEGSKFGQITELLRTHFPKEEKLLEQIALEEMPTSVTDTELSHLLGYHLIELNEGKYRITLNLLKRWLRQHAGIEE